MAKTYYFDFLRVKNYELLIVVSEKGLSFVDFVSAKTKWTNFEKWFKAKHQLITLEKDLNKTKLYSDALTNYFAKKLPLIDAPLDLNGTAFQVIVWKKLLTIKHNQLITYQDLANSLNMPRSTRAVASAVAKNRILLFVPCHRVISKNKDIKYGPGLTIKKMLINLESSQANH